MKIRTISYAKAYISDGMTVPESISSGSLRLAPESGGSALAGNPYPHQDFPPLHNSG